MEKSQFEKLKSQGNDQLKDFDNLPLSIKEFRVQKALDYYQDAIELAKTKQDKASIFKNQGFVALKQAAVVPDSSPEMKIYWIIQCLKYYNKALYFGIDCMDQEWKNSITKNQEKIQSLIESCICGCDSSEKILIIEKCERYIHEDLDLNRYKCNIILAQSYYNIAVTKLDNKLLSAANQNLNMTRMRYGRVTLSFKQFKGIKPYYVDNDLLKELEENMGTQEIYIMAKQELTNGDKAFQQAFFKEEELDMDALYNSIDHYKNAINFCYKVKDHELIAMAQSQLGRLFYKGLKLPKKARDYFTDCLKSAAEIEHKNVAILLWYQVAQSQLQEIRNKDLRQETLNEEAEKQKYIEQLKDKLDEIDLELKKTHQDVLKLLQSKYKSKSKPDYTLTETDLKPANMKKTLLRIISYYHPDKQPLDDKLNYVFSQEITKRLNGIYTIYKGD